LRKAILIIKKSFFNIFHHLQKLPRRCEISERERERERRRQVEWDKRSNKEIKNSSFVLEELRMAKNEIK
jgi:hypothetical protein